jgi:hypothetical protein
MASTPAITYVERLLDNDYVHENLHEGVANLRALYLDARQRKAAEAARDKKLYRRLHRGVGSLTEAAVALRTGREKPKRRGRTLIVLVVAGGGVAVVAKSRLGARGAPETASG